MKNVIIACTLFLVMVGSMIFSLTYLNKVCSNIEKITDTLEEQIIAEQWDKANKTSTYLLEEWKDHGKVIPIFVNHTEIDAINSETLKLTQYVRCKTTEEALASTHAVKFYLDNIKSLQKINIQNIF